MGRDEGRRGRCSRYLANGVVIDGRHGDGTQQSNNIINSHFSGSNGQ